ncbi:glycosyltransferase family 39 protein (plasmid) [Serratia nevei]|uniref:glycosyltransferase family 39 protein n=1 Tax=Serratia nevei TaxID=2703794 RepID=UPI003F6C717A
MTNYRVYLWLLAYAVLWTLATLFLDPTVPYDAVEALNWATNAEWGSPKNPWLVGAIIRPAVLLDMPLPFYWYASHFLCVALGMLGIWILTHRLTQNTSLAWLAMLALNLSGIINIDIIPYNDNYLLVMLWPWMLLFFYQAITQGPAWWLAFAATAGLAIMAKYSTAIFVYFILLATLGIPEVRRCYRTPYFYLAILLGGMIVTPNLVWLWQHDFAAFRWIDSQVQLRWNGHILVSLLSVFYPVLLLKCLLLRGAVTFSWPTSTPQRVLCGVYLLPLGIITFWFSFNVGGRLTEWLQPFFVFAPVLLMMCVKLPVTGVRRRDLVILSCLAPLVLTGYTTVMTLNIKNAGQKMSGVKPFSLDINREWQHRYHRPLRYVGGAYLSQWLTFYIPSHPQTLTHWSDRTRPNIYNAHLNPEDIMRQGAVLVADAGQDCTSADFSAPLSLWASPPVMDKQLAFFQADPHSVRLPVCIAFVSPQAGKK